MNYIKLTTNLPNPTNTYRVATYQIRQIRPISVQKNIRAVFLTQNPSCISSTRHLPIIHIIYRLFRVSAKKSPSCISYWYTLPLSLYQIYK